MTDPQNFLNTWVRESVQATPHRNKAEARRLTYECRKAADRAGATWAAVIKAAGGKPRLIFDSGDGRNVTAGLSWQPLRP